MASGEIVQKTIAAVVGRNRFPNSRGGEREILWPQNSEIVTKAAYRGSSGRDHGDIPLVELAVSRLDFASPWLRGSRGNHSWNARTFWVGKARGVHSRTF
jgi:hypothetical protein